MSNEIVVPRLPEEPRVPRLPENEQEELRQGLQQIAREKEAAEEGLESRNENSTVQQQVEMAEQAAADAEREVKANSRKIKKEDGGDKSYYGKISSDRKLRRVRRHVVSSNPLHRRHQHLKQEIKDLQQLAANRQKEIQVLQNQITQEKARYNKLLYEYRRKTVHLGCCEQDKENLEEDQLKLVRQCIGDEQENEKLERIIRDMLFRLSQLGGPQEAEDWVNDYTGLNGYDPRDN